MIRVPIQIKTKNIDLSLRKKVTKKILIKSFSVLTNYKTITNQVNQPINQVN